MTRKESGWVAQAMELDRLCTDACVNSTLGEYRAARDALRAHLTSLQSAAEGLEEALQGLIDYFPNGATFERMGISAAPAIAAYKTAHAALSAFNAIKGK